MSLAKWKKAAVEGATVFGGFVLGEVAGMVAAGRILHGASSRAEDERAQKTTIPLLVGLGGVLLGGRLGAGLLANGLMHGVARRLPSDKRHFLPQGRYQFIAQRGH